MSIRLMTAVWDMDLPPSEKLVLLALADWADADGLCWPSISKVAKKSGVSERTVQRTLRDAETAKIIHRVETAGRGCKYTFDPRHCVTPDKVSPVTNATPTPDTVSPYTVNRTTKGESETREGSILALPQWKAFKAMRAQIKKPINPTAQKRLIAKLIGLVDEGYPAGDVLDQSTEHCWQGVFKIEEKEDGGIQTNRGNSRRMGGPQPDPTLAIVRAAIAAQRQDSGDNREARPALPSS